MSVGRGAPEEGWSALGKGGHRWEGRTPAGRSGLGKAGQRREPPAAMERALLPGLATPLGRNRVEGKHIWVA